MKNIMLDLETLGQNSFAPIFAIGAVYFDNNGLGDTFYKKIDLKSSFKYCTPDASTLLWWLRQGEEARAEFKDNNKEDNLNFVLDEFTSFIKFGSNIWGNGSDFDNVILANSYRALDKEVPWIYPNNRCFRTLKNLYPSIKLEYQSDKTQHIAIDDAIYQALWTVEICKQKRIDLG
jgi:hypothetical protein